MNALLLVDLQYDFMPGGALAVAGGDELVAVANGLIPEHDRVFCTQDWHPKDHGSFVTAHPGKSPGEMTELAGLPQVVWPVHCVQDTRGAAFHESLNLPADAIVVPKGTRRDVDSYSGFFDNARRHQTGLEAALREAGVTSLTVMGLATDYCVKATALDAAELGFETTLWLEGCRAVELSAGDGERAVAEMRDGGVVVRG